MDSPSERNRINTKLKESPLFSDLSPLKSAKAQHSQSFPLANFSIPPVFMSPRMEERGQSFPKSMEIDTADSQHCVRNDSSLQTENVNNFQDEQVLSPSEYLASDPPDLEEEDQRHSNVSRHLHFGATMGCSFTGNETHDSVSSSLLEALPHIQLMVPYQNEPSRITSSLQAGSPAHSVASYSTSCHSESFEPTHNYVHEGTVCIPSHFGLPFSTVTRSLSMDSDLISPFKFVGCQNKPEETQGKDLDSVSHSYATRDFYAPSGDYQKDSQTSATVGSADYPTIRMQSPNSSIYLTQYDHSYELKMLNSLNTDTVEELNKASPKRNRKRGKDVSDSEGCKHCNCKRSKCLKLYCECFAAGVYCLDTCACENCFNRPEYEDTVLDTRQQIETRNPLAFVPKVVKPSTSAPANMEEASGTTPSSARHKRGCNCKKSKCLKKYCECYQAGVGCYNGCRCEDCNNCFGRKSESVYRRMEKWESPSHELMDVFVAPSDFIETGNVNQFPSKWEGFSNMNLTPLSHESSVSCKGSSLQSSTAFSHQYSSDSLTPQLLGRKVLSEINSNGLFYNLVEDSTPGIFRNMPTPLKPVQASSPNQKHVSPSQIRAQDLRSSSSQGLKSVCKMNLPPSHLTPYSQLKSGVPGIEDDIIKLKDANDNLPT